MSLSYSLSGDDITDFLGEKVRIIKYSELQRFNSIDEVLSPYNACFILYETQKNYGHWTVLFRNRWGVEFFDSYGSPIDEMISGLKKDYSAGGAQSYPYLTRLILKGLANKNEPLHIISNKVQLQADGKNITTCGRWCLFRYINRRSDLRSFIDIFKNVSDKDLLVTKLILLGDSDRK